MFTKLATETYYRYSFLKLSRVRPKASLHRKNVNWNTFAKPAIIMIIII